MLTQMGQNSDPGGLKEHPGGKVVTVQREEGGNSHSVTLWCQVGHHGKY